MKVEQSSFLDFIGSPDVRFTIPAYQRRYAWQERQCEELWLDILRAGRRGEGHFSGTVLYEEVPACEGDSCGDANPICELSIVDGQQRMTTIMLMLAALRNYLKAHPDKSIEGLDPTAVEETYLFTASESGNEGADAVGSENESDGEAGSSHVPKLIPSRLDTASMRMAVEGAPADSIPSHNISHNLAFFESLMDEEAFDIETFARGLKNLGIVKAEMLPDDDAQAVFESLNSKGLQLTIADMVRNYLLAGESHDEQTRLYIDYWTVIEGVFAPDPGSLRLDTMIKAWLSVRFPKVRARTPEDVYSAFKRYYDDEYAGDLEPVLNELRSFSMVWAENYRYHAVKKFRSMPWATNGAQTLTSGYELKKADNEEYAEKVRQELRAMGRNL